MVSRFALFHAKIQVQANSVELGEGKMALLNI